MKSNINTGLETQTLYLRSSKLIESHDVDPEKIDELWSDYHQANFNFDMQNVDLRFRLKQHLSLEQWSQVFPAKPQ